MLNFRRYGGGPRLRTTLLWLVPPAIILNQYVVTVATVSGRSMQPTLNPKSIEQQMSADVIVVDRLAASLGTIDRGDVVVLVCPYDPDLILVKRVIAFHGDVVRARPSPQSSPSASKMMPLMLDSRGAAVLDRDARRRLRHERQMRQQHEDGDGGEEGQSKATLARQLWAGTWDDLGWWRRWWSTDKSSGLYSSIFHSITHEPQMGPPSTASLATSDIITVPPGHCWVESDDLEVGADSNIFGPVPVGLLLGRAAFIAWPPSRMSFLRNQMPKHRHHFDIV